MREYEYRHETLWKGERTLSGVFSRVLCLLIWIFIIVDCIWRLLHGYPDRWFTSALWILLGALWVLRLCEYLYGFWWGGEPKIKVALSEQGLSIRSPRHNHNLVSSSHVNVNFSLDEIVDARVANLDDPEARIFITPCPWWRFYRTSDHYPYAFFLRERQPLQKGHQAVELKLQSDSRVLIETDDVENFLAALKRSGVGGSEGGAVLRSARFSSEQVKIYREETPEQQG